MTRVKLTTRIGLARLGLILSLVLISAAAGRATAVLHARTTIAPSAPLESPNIDIEKTPDTQEIAQGGTANFTIIITNTGSVDLENIEVNDLLAPDCDRMISSLAVGESTTPYNCQRSNVTQSFLNEVIVTAAAVVTGDQTADSDTAFVKVDNPNIKIVKSPDSQTIVKGSAAQFSIIVLNTSASVDLKDVQVFDPLTPACNKNIGTLNHGASVDYTCSQTNVTSPFANVATVIGTNINNNGQVNDTDAAIVEVLDLAVDYTVDPTTLTEPGGPGTYTVRVTNHSSADVAFTSLTSSGYGNLFSSSNGNIQNNTCTSPPADLAANGGAYTCTFDVIFNSQPVTITDTVTATAAAAPVSVSANDSAAISITDVPPSITVSLTAVPSFVVAPGDDVEFTVRVYNNSSAENVTLIALSDTLLGDLNGQGTCSLATIASLDTYQCLFTTAVTGSPGTVVNTVTATGSDNDGGSISDSDQVTITISVRPITYLYLPLIANNYVFSEPNNTCAEAYPITINQDLYFLPDDFQDWYWFELANTSNVVVRLTDFLPVDGQIVAYSTTDGTCDTLQFLANNGNFSPTKIIDLGSQPAGRYYIRVIKDGPASTIPYKLHIQAP